MMHKTKDPISKSKHSHTRAVFVCARNLCLVSLSWDGVAILDVAEGPNRFKVVAQHSASFAGAIHTFGPYGYYGQPS